MNEYKDDSYYRTSNFYSSCFLLCNGFQLVDIDKTNPQRAEFIFEDGGNISNLIRDFDFAEKQSPNVMVDARDFVIAIKALKDKLYQKV